MPRLAALLLLSIAVSLLPAASPATAAAVAAQEPSVPPAHAPAIPGAGAPPAAPGHGNPGASGANGPGGAGLAFQLPAAWVSENPASNMRLAQASIPGAAGAGQFAIFFFGAGGGGSTEANIERWVGQIDKPTAPTHREAFSTHGLKVTWVEAAGTMKPSTVGMGPATAQPGTRLLAAVVEGPGGPWYLKVVGPDATVKAAQPAFVNLLRGLHPR
jgi:hypothetical protein